MDTTSITTGGRLPRRVPIVIPAAVPGVGAFMVRRDADGLHFQVAGSRLVINGVPSLADVEVDAPTAA
jgi:hypothetical protein